MFISNPDRVIFVHIPDRVIFISNPVRVIFIHIPDRVIFISNLYRVIFIYNYSFTNKELDFRF